MSSPAMNERGVGLAAVVAVVLVVAACTGGGGAGQSAGAAPASAAAPSPTEAASPSASATASATAEATGEEYRIEVATDAKVGKYLAGEDGKTLYIFKKDTQPNASVCTGECATNWPPLVVEGSEKVEAGDGVTGTIATFARSDGSMQVSYNGMPLYYFKGDAKAGDLNGQGLADGAWVAATP